MAPANLTNSTQQRKWYREPWVWLLIALPLSAVIGGAYTAWLAVKTSDGLVTEDYYKQGLAVSETLSRNRHADELGISAGMRLTSDTVSLKLSSTSQEWKPPKQLLLTLSHPTRAGLDQSSVLQFAGERYVGSIRVPASGHWLVLVEDEAKTWRILSSVSLPSSGEILIGHVGKPVDD